MSVQNNNVVIWKAGRGTTVNVDQVNKCKRTRDSNESTVGLRQQPYKTRIPEVRRFKTCVPSSLGNRDRKRRPPNRDSHKRRLPSSTSSNQQVKKRDREENNGQVTARSPRHAPAEE
ncbi:hypothetical protein TNCV_4241131 [Trichonephila clavipes]|nr:hypothetical protein TNCV_4241131 [Trichonephila clavipes]